MKKLNLSPEDAQDLVQGYKSDLRKLEFEVERIKSAIEILEKGKVSERGETTTSKKRGRPRKQLAVVITPEKKVAKGKRGRPSKAKQAGKVTAKKAKGKAKAAKPKKVKTAVKAAAKKATTNKTAKAKVVKEKKKTAVPKKERKPRTSTVAVAWDNFVLETLKNSGKAMIKSELLEAAKKAPLAAEMDEKQVSQRLAQSIHKLSNVTKEVVKTYHLGRGHAFALKDWVDKNGDLLPQYQREESPIA